MPDCLFETKCENGELETKFFDVRTNEPIKQWSWPEPPDDHAFTNYGSLAEFVASNSQKVFRVIDLNEEAYGCPCTIYGLWPIDYIGRTGEQGYSAGVVVKLFCNTSG